MGGWKEIAPPRGEIDVRVRASECRQASLHSWNAAIEAAAKVAETGRATVYSVVSSEIAAAIRELKRGE